MIRVLETICDSSDCPHGCVHPDRGGRGCEGHAVRAINAQYDPWFAGGLAQRTKESPASQDARDAARYRWLREFSFMFGDDIWNYDNSEAKPEDLVFRMAGYRGCGQLLDQHIDASLPTQQKPSPTDRGDG